MKGDVVESSFKSRFQIRSYEVDSQRKVKPVTLLDYLQDAASEHAKRLGVSVTDLLPKNITWVLSRYHVKIMRYPLLGESIQVNTWPSARQRFLAIRDFEVTDEKGDALALATSSWILLNLRNKRPARLDNILPDYPILNRRTIEDDFNKPLPAPERADIELPFRVRMGDLDLNGHVNHTVYIEWALETAPQEILQKNRPVEIEAAFRGEAFYGDRIISRTQVIEDAPSPCLLHQLINEKDGNELTRLKTSWK